MFAKGTRKTLKNGVGNASARHYSTGGTGFTVVSFLNEISSDIIRGFVRNGQFLADFWPYLVMSFG